MDTNQKLELFNLLTDTGSCYQNEVRTAFGMRPLPELTGKLATSSNKNNAINNMGESPVNEEKDTEVETDEENEPVSDTLGE